MTARRYRDMHEHLQALEERDLLIRVAQPINKDTEMHPLVRWQYRGGIPEEERKAWLFENVTDAKGRHYRFPVTVGALAATPTVYAVGLQCDLSEVPKRWEEAYRHPIPPVLVESGPVHEEIHRGGELSREGGGFEEFPIPISTPGFDNAPYTTCSHWITKDPDTGIRNVGNYRGQIKSRTRIGVYAGQTKDGRIHWRKHAERGLPLQAALVIGAPPVVSYAAVQKIPYGTDELAVAGGLAGEPIRLVKCLTVDLEVPAEAELVVEGVISTEWLEPEGPFGESHGYIHPREMSPFMEVTAITHRKQMVYVSITSQVTPSESSVIKKVGYDTLFLHHLREECGFRNVTRVLLHEPLTNLRKLILIQMRPTPPRDVMRILKAAASFHEGVGKILIALDEDIDPTNLDAVMWALCYRMKPHQDTVILTGRSKGHAPPFSRGGDDRHKDRSDSALLINALLKEPFPPISLPTRPYMERARKIWEELGLPPLHPENPWFGYSLGDWDEELEEEAQAAVRGEHYATGEKQAQKRQRVALNRPAPKPKGTRGRTGKRRTRS